MIASRLRSAATLARHPNLARRLVALFYARFDPRREGDRAVALAEIAERQEISLPYLEQLFAKLRRGGLVAAVRGAPAVPVQAASLLLPARALHGSGSGPRGPQHQ